MLEFWLNLSRLYLTALSLTSHYTNSPGFSRLAWKGPCSPCHPDMLKSYKGRTWMDQMTRGLRRASRGDFMLGALESLGGSVEQRRVWYPWDLPCVSQNRSIWPCETLNWKTRKLLLCRRCNFSDKQAWHSDTQRCRWESPLNSAPSEHTFAECVSKRVIIHAQRAMWPWELTLRTVRKANKTTLVSC